MYKGIGRKEKQEEKNPAHKVVFLCIEDAYFFFFEIFAFLYTGIARLLD